MDDAPEFTSIEAQAAAWRAGSEVGYGRFTLIQELGRGGMGVVWLARDKNLGELVALKFLPPEVAADPVAVNDLRRETVRSHRLTHPNIVRIHDFHQQPDGVVFISMEYVDGLTLSGWRLQQEKQVCSWAQLTPLVRQLCAALEYAHAEGVIHRDLKPANVMLDSKGRVKLADFGIAAVVSDSSSRVSARSNSGGTLAYMSPQQIRGMPPTVADDLYALGASLYELLSGRPPFYRGDITHQVLKEPATPLADRLLELGLDNPVPKTAAAVIVACLAKEPVRRPQSTSEVGEWFGLAHPILPPAEAPIPELEAAPTLPEPGHRGFFVGIPFGLAILIVAAFAFNQTWKPGGNATATGVIKPRLVDTLLKMWYGPKNGTNDGGKDRNVRNESNNTSNIVQNTNPPLGYGEKVTISDPVLDDEKVRLDTKAPSTSLTSRYPPRLKVIANHKANLAIGLPSGVFINEELSSVSPTNPKADWIWGTSTHWGRYNQKANIESGEWRLIVSSERYNTIRQNVRVYAGITNEVRITLTEWTVPHRGYDWLTTNRYRMMPIGRSFWAGEREVTVAEFREFAAVKKLARENFRVYKNFRWEPGPDSWASLPDQDPVSGVTAIEADQFCEWLTQRERDAGRLNATQKYQLPSHKHWMELYDPAATLWPADEDGLPPTPYVANLAGQELRQRLSLEVGRKLAPWTDGYPFAAPADGALAKPPYPLQGTYKLYHIVGNVAEWSADADPDKPSKRLVHGGSWFDSSRDSFCRTCQIPVEATRRAANIGFRVILVDSDLASEEP